MQVRSSLAVGYLLLLSICCFAAQGPPPGPLSVRNARSFTPETLPERIAYEAFFVSVVAHERRASEPQFSAEQRQLIGERLQLIAQLEEAEFDLVKEISRSMLAALEDLGREGSFLQNPSIVPAQRSAALAALQRRREGVIDTAIHQLRTSLGEARFREVDQRIREHIARSLRAYDLQPAGSEVNRGSGGN